MSNPTEIAKRLKVTNPGNVDSLRGPYPDLAAANAAIPNVLIEGISYREGKFVEIGTAGNYKTYWWNGADYADNKLMEYQALYSIKDSSGNLVFIDSVGRIPAYLSSKGEFGIAKFTEATEERIMELDPLTVVKTNDGVYGWVDVYGKMPAYLNNKGEFGIAKFTKATEERIKEIANIENLKDKIYGKKISIIGDSISTSDGAAGIFASDTYIGRLIELQKCSVFVNAIGDSRISQGGSAAIDFTDDTRWSTLAASNPDIILIFGGINDSLQNVPIGVIGDTDRNNNFFGALDYLYSHIMAASPNSRVFHMTPLHHKYVTGGSFIPERNSLGLYLSDYVNAIKQVAGRYGVGIIDTNSNSGITCYNINNLAPSDKIHIKEAGHLMVYKTIVNSTNYLLHN